MRSRWSLLPVALTGSTSGYATVYLTVAQAQAAIFPKAALTSVSIILTPSQHAQIEKKSGVRVRSDQLQAWRVSDGSWFIVDEVLGKHEFITYAIGIDCTGSVVGIEILDYRETYGGEVKNEKWRAQFRGKTSTAKLKLDDDIKNISGATLSSRHITDGVKRILTTYEFALKNTS